MFTAAEQRQAMEEDGRFAPGGRPKWVFGGFLPHDSAVPGLTAEQVSDLSAVIDTGDSPVQQAFREEVDINTIVARYGVTRQSAADTMGVYGDFTGITDFYEAQQRLEGARERFMQLDPAVRARFGNDPGQLIQAVNELSGEEFAKLMDPPKEEKPAEPPAS